LYKKKKGSVANNSVDSYICTDIYNSMFFSWFNI